MQEGFEKAALVFAAPDTPVAAEVRSRKARTPLQRRETLRSGGHSIDNAPD